MAKALPSSVKEFVDEATYHNIVDEVIIMAKKLGASSAEVGLQASIGLNVTVRLKEVETLEFNRDKSLGITVYLGNHKGSASTTDISMESLRSTVQAAINLAKFTEPDPFAGLAQAAEMAKTPKSLDLYHPWDLTVEEAIAISKSCEQSALAFDKKITNTEGASLSSTQGYYVYGNTNGFLGYYPTSRHSLSCTVIAQDHHGMERDYQYTLSRQHRLLEPAEKIGQEAAERSLLRLNAKKLSTRKVPVLFHASIASGIISHFTSAISGGRLFRKSTFLLDSLGKKIFPNQFHIYERPHILSGIASAPFDSDGVATTDKDFVHNGVIQNYVLSAYSARKLNMPNTGNAGGVHNLFVKSDDIDYKALLKKMDKGLLVMEVMGPGINLVTGDYSRGAQGFWVENGEIQYPVHEITIAGNLKNMFQHIVAVGNDIDKRGGIQTGSLLVEEMMLAGA